MTERRVSRRFFINRTVPALAIGSLIAARGGVELSSKKPPEYTLPTPEQLEIIQKFNPITIAHRDANNARDARRASEIGVSHLEGDWNLEAGSVDFYHGQKLGRGGVVIGRFDADVKEVGLGPAAVSQEQGVDIAAQNDVGLFLELKRGQFESKHFKNLYKQTQAADVDLKIFSPNIDYVNSAIEATYDPNIGVYLPKTPEAWRRIKSDTRIRPTQILTDTESVYSNIDFLTKNNIDVYVGGVYDPITVISLLRTGAVKGFINHRDVLRGIFQPSDYKSHPLVMGPRR